MSIVGYIHICQKEGWQRSLKMCLSALHESGLYERSEVIRVGIVNDVGVLIADRLLEDSKIDIVYVGKSMEYERPTLLHMRKMAERDRMDTVYYYLHTKGLQHFGTDREENVIDWIKLMLYWNIEEWRLAIEKLKEYDTYGCNDTGIHYSGNFWWATQKHILKLPETINPVCYLAPENWVQTERVNKYCVYNSGLQGMGHYSNRFPRELYVK